MFDKVLTGVLGVFGVTGYTVSVINSQAVKAWDYLKSQSYYPELKAKWVATSFTVNLGDFPEFNTKGYTLVKSAGSYDVNYQSNGRNGGKFTLSGLVAAAKKKVGNNQAKVAELQREATAKADLLKAKRAEAQKLADALRQAEAEVSRAQVEADSAVAALSNVNSSKSKFSSLVSSF